MPASGPRATLGRHLAGLVAALVVVGLVACDPSSLPPGIQVSIDEGERSVRVGGELQLAASVSGGLGIDTGVRWSSGDPDVASVDDEGLVTGVAEGEVAVRATSVVDPRASDSVVITVTPDGVLLPGDPASPAVAATYDYSVPIDRDPSLVSVDEDAPLRPQIHRGEIEIAFDPSATVGEVNALLEDLDARIVDMLPDHPQLIVRIPDPGSLAGLRALVDDVAADPRVDVVLLSEIVEPPITEEPGVSEVRTLVLPDGIGSRLGRIDHHLAIRLHAAWHVRSALAGSSQRPWLVVPDFYGDGRPDTTYYDATFASGEYATGDPHSHGYHVLGIMVGAFDSVLAPGTPDPDEQANDDVTGAVPATLRVRAVDLQAENTSNRNMNRAISRIEHILDGNADARIIVNTSLGNRSSAETYARSWTRKVRGWLDATTVGAGLEHTFLHFTSAGNAERDDDGNIIATWPAVDNSTYTYAALGDMSATFGRDYPNLTNVLVVENRRNSAHGAAGSRPLAGCASDGSIMGGTLSAIGTSVYSFGTTLDSDLGLHDAHAPSNKSGTSMSSPQAAGVAALVWSLAPDLSVPALRDLLLATALDDPGPAVGPCNSAAPQPVVDAYAAVLAAGGQDAWRAILDVDGNGVFDEFDVAAYLAAFADQGATLSYDRFDLSGDGRSGSPSRTERVDLDGDGTYGTVSRSIAGRTVSYDESAVSDHDVLCYHAYSSLYQGSTSARSELLDGVCAHVAVRITTPRDGATISHSGNVSFRAELYTTWPGAPAIDPAPYTITWSYAREDGERAHLGTVEPGDTLNARPVCRDAVVTAEARHRNVARVSRDSVAFTLTSAGPGPWRTQVTLPESNPSYLNVNLSESTLALQGMAWRPTCAGPEVAAPSALRWSIVGDTSFAPVSGASLTVTPALLTVDGSFTERTFQLRREGGPATTHTVIPCTALAFGSLRRCPDPALQNAFEEALSRRFQDYLDAREARQALEAELRGLFDDTLPEPFPLPSSTLNDRLGATLGSFEWEMSFQLFDELFGLTLEADDAGFKANLLDLEVRASDRLGELVPEVLELFLAASEVAQATHTLFLPFEEGGADAWSGFLFATDEALDGADVTVPVEAALNGFLTGYVETYRGGSVGFSFEAANVEMSLDAGAIAGALAAIAVLEPPRIP